MKKNFTFSILLSIVILYTLSSNNINVVSGNNVWSNTAFNSCAGCHGGTSANTIVDSIKLISSTTGIETTGFYPDSTYKIRLVAHNTLSKPAMGFILRAVNSATSVSIGSMSSPPASTGFIAAGTTLTQSSAISAVGGFYTVEVTWTAPSAATAPSTINLQSIVNAIDQTGNQANDNVSTIKTVGYNKLGAIGNLNCAGGSTTGILVSGIAASGVSISVPYTGGNAGTFSAQSIPSTGITGLTADINSGTFANGSGNLTFNINGTPSGIGNAVFSLNIGGKSCIYTIAVQAGAITSINCNGGITNGILTAGQTASSVSFDVPYNGGNGGNHTGQIVNSTGVTGLTATLTNGTFAVGAGTLSYDVTGTPNTSGVASFALNIGGQTCNFTMNVNAPLASVSTLNCNNGRKIGSMTLATPASGVSFKVPYTGGNSGTYPLQNINSTGATGLTANRTAGSVVNGADSVTYTVTGTPTGGAVAGFPISLGGQSCTFNFPISLPPAAITSLNCGSGVLTGSLVKSVSASGVSVAIPYSGGNSGYYTTQSYTSTGVTGLTATLNADTLKTTSGNINLIISGTPSNSGVASFVINFGGQSCTYNATVLAGTVATLSCNTGMTIGTLVGTIPASNVYFLINYTGGNGSTHNGQIIASTGVTGLSAKTDTGNFKNGDSVLRYNISGTPLSHGTASFALNIGGKNCIYTITVDSTMVDSILCSSIAIEGSGYLVHGVSVTYGGAGLLMKIPYKNGNGGSYSNQTINSTGVNGLGANLNGANLYNGDSSLSFNILGTPTSHGDACFTINIGGKSCNTCLKIDSGMIASMNCSGASISGSGILNQGSSTNGLTLSLPVTGGNRGSHNGQIVNSTGVTGVTASLVPNYFIGTQLDYNLTGTPSSSGIASFAFNIGGQSCSFDIAVKLPIATITSINCTGGKTSGLLYKDTTVNNVSFYVPVTGANGGVHFGQTINSTGVTGLTAILSNDTLLNGADTLIYQVSGTPSGYGNANFALNLGGKSCTYTITINYPAGSITSIDCPNGMTKGSLNSGTAASGVSFKVPVSGANGGIHTGQTVTSTNVTGLTAKLLGDTLMNGMDTLMYTVAGTPNSAGSASFVLLLSGQRCEYFVNVDLPVAKVTTLNCGNSIVNNSIISRANVPANTTISIPFTGSNLGVYPAQLINSTGITGLVASLNADTLKSASANIVYNITGLPSNYGTANFAFNFGGKSCSYPLIVNPHDAMVDSIDCNGGVMTGTMTAYIPSSGVSFKLPYIKGNGGKYLGKTISSTNVLGLTATLATGFLNDGVNGNLNFTISGTPKSQGLANFEFTIGGKSCTFSCLVNKVYLATITDLYCDSGKTTGTLTENKIATGVSFTVPYKNGNGGYDFGQTATSTGVTGLSATVVPGYLANGNGNAKYTVTGTPSGYGIADFNIAFADHLCHYQIKVKPAVGKVNTLECYNGATSVDILVGKVPNNTTITIPYKGGNGAPYSAFTVNSTDVIGLTASTPAGSFNEGNGNLIFTLSGTSTKAGIAKFWVEMGGAVCSYEQKVVGSNVNIQTAHIDEIFISIDEILHLETVKSQVEVNISDLSGKIVYASKSNSNLDLSQIKLNQGIYFVQIKSDHVDKVIKWMKD